MDIKDALALGNLGALAAVVIVYLVLESKKKPLNGNGHSLSASQELRVRELIEELVIRQGLGGGLHDLKNKVTQLLWEQHERKQ